MKNEVGGKDEKEGKTSTKHHNFRKLLKPQTFKRFKCIIISFIHKRRNFPSKPHEMSLFASTNDGVHIERVNAEKIGKRGIFINVADDNGRTQSEHQTAGFIRLRNNLNISPGERGREAFTKTLSKVRDNALYQQPIKRRRETLPLHSNYANYENTIPKFATKGGSKFWCEDRINFG